MNQMLMISFFSLGCSDVPSSDFSYKVMAWYNIIKYSDNWSCWAATIKKQRYVAIRQQHRQDSEGAKYQEDLIDAPTVLFSHLSSRLFSKLRYNGHWSLREMDVKQQYIFDSHLILTVLKIECYLGFMLYARQRIMEPQKKHPANPIDEMLK